MASDLKVYVIFAKADPHVDPGLRRTLRSVELYPASDLSFLELIKSQLKEVDHKDLDRDGSTPEKEGYVEWLMRPFFGRKDHLKKSSLSLTFKRYLPDKKSLMLELSLSEVMNKEVKMPQVQSRKYFDWIYFELYNILLVGLKDLPNIREEPFTEQLATIQRSKQQGHKKVVEELKKCLGEVKAPLKELQYKPYVLSESWNDTRKLEEKLKHEQPPKSWDDQIRENVQQLFSKDFKDMNDSHKIWHFIETSESLHIAFETRKTHKLFPIMFKLLTVGIHFLSKDVKIYNYNQMDKKDLWFRIMDELMAKFKLINFYDELTEEDITDLIKHVLGDDAFPDILIDQRKAELMDQPILALIATKMSPSFLEVKEEEGVLVSSNVLQQLVNLISRRYGKGMQLFFKTFFGRLFLRPGDLEDKYLKSLDLIWHYLKDETFESHLKKLISSTNSYHQSYCSMVTKVLEARLKIQTVEEVKGNTVKPYMLAYLDSMGLEDSSKIYEIVDNVVKLHEGKELPLEIQRFVFLDKTGVVNPETATKSLSKEFKERFFNDNSAIKKVIDEVFLSKTEDYPEYISIDLVLNTYESKRLDLQKSRPQLLIDYSKECTPHFTQMMRFIIRLLKHEKQNRIQTELFKNSHFVVYYQTLTKFFEEEKKKSLRKGELEQLKEIKNSTEEKLKLIEGNDEFWTRFRGYLETLSLIDNIKYEVKSFVDTYKELNDFKFYKTLDSKLKDFERDYNTEAMDILKRSDFLKCFSKDKTKILSRLAEMDGLNLLQKSTYIDKTLDEINDSVSREFDRYDAKYKSFLVTDPKAEDKFTLTELRLLFTGFTKYSQTELASLSDKDFRSDKRFLSIWKLFNLTDRTDIIIEKCMAIVGALRLSEIGKRVVVLRQFDLFKKTQGKEAESKDDILAQLGKFGAKVDQIKEGLTQKVVSEDLKLLKNNEKLKYLNLGFISTLASSDKVFEFLNTKGKDSIGKMANELDMKAQGYTADLTTLTLKLGFVYELKKEGFNFTDDIFLKLIALSEKEQIELADILGRLSYDIETINDLCLKATGDTKEIIEQIHNRGLLYIGFETELDRHVFFVEITKTGDKSENKDENKEVNKEANKEVNKDANKDANKETKETAVEPIIYNFHDMTSFINIVKELPDQISEKADAKQIELKKVINCFIKIGKEIQKLTDLFTNLYNLGIIGTKIDQNFHEYIIELIQSKTSAEDKTSKALQLSDKGVLTIPFKDCDFEKTYMHIELKYRDWLHQYQEGLTIGHDAYMLSFFAKTSLYNLLKSIIKGEPEEVTMTLLRESKKLKELDLEKKLGELTSVWKVKDKKTKTDTFEGALPLAIDFCQKLKDLVKTNSGSTSKSQSNKVRIHRRTTALYHEYETILNIFVNNLGKSYTFSQFLFGSKNINELEMEAFLCRALYDQEGRFYFIINFKEFEPRVQSKLFNCIKEFSQSINRANLIIFDNSLVTQFQFEHDETYEEFIDDDYDQTKQSADKPHLFTQMSRITAVLSKNSGGGKSHFIQRKITEMKKESPKEIVEVEISISGEVNIHSLAKRASILHNLMKEAKRNNQKVVIVCKLDYIENFKKYVNIIDYFFFCLCFLGSVHIAEGTGILDQNDIKHIFVEIGNSTKEDILAEIQVVKYLKQVENIEWYKKHSKELNVTILHEIPDFKIDHFDYIDSKDSNEQTTCRFLQELNHLESLKSSQSAALILIPISKKPVVPEADYRKLLGQKKFGNYRELNLWIATLANSYKGIEENAEVLKTDLDKETCDPFHLRLEILQEIYNLGNCMLYFRSDDAKQVQILIREYMKNHEEVQSMKRESDSNKKTEKEIQDREDNKKRIKEDIEKVKPFKWDTKNLIIPLFKENRALIGVFSDEVFRVNHQGDNAEGEKAKGVKAEGDKAKGDKAEGDKAEGDNSFESRVAYKRLMNRANTKQFIKEIEKTKIPKAAIQDSQVTDIETHSKLLAKLCYFLQIEYLKKIQDSEKFGNGKGFRITEESYMKILMMLQKSQIKQPIILMGESGCGKTYLSSYLVETILEETLQIICLFAGFSLDDLDREMQKAIKAAEDLMKLPVKPNCSPKNVWIFFDEFNTTAIQAQIADIMLDRKFQGKALPPNLLFIACCNPYRMKLGGKASRDIGLVVNQKTSILSHVVHVVPDRLLDIVWNFGQLSEEDEKHHILSMVRGEKDLFPDHTFDGRDVDEIHVKLALVIYQCHSLVRKFEEKSGVSLRDIKRVFVIFIFFRKAFIYMQKEQKKRDPKLNIWYLKDNISMMIAATICSLHVCYGFRLNGQDKEKAEMFEILFKWTSYMHTFCRLKPKYVNSCILDVATFFLKGIDLEENISDNVPFKENFIAMLVCINTLTPLIIVGAPGASKTLSSQVLLKHLQERRNFFDEEVKKDFTLTEKPVDVRFFAGTELTTPQEIKQVFEKAKQVSKQVTGLVFIDELGLAEISEKNPLKVLHPYLEAKDRDYAFVGISNWVLDLSKMNRMIFLARPELSSTELMAIFEKYMSTGIKQDDQNVSKMMMDSLIKAYLRFRTFEKSNIKKSDDNRHYYHRDFHGSRDIYGMYNYLGTYWKNAIKDGMGPVEPMTAAKMHHLLIEAIERNMNGEIFTFKKPEEITESEAPLRPEILEYLRKKFTVIKNARQDLNLKPSQDEDKEIEEKREESVNNEKGKNDSNDVKIEKQEPTSSPVVMSSSEVFKAFFYSELLNYSVQIQEARKFSEIIPDYIQVGVGFDNLDEVGNIKKTITENLKSKDSRFMLVRCEGEIVENIFVNDVKYQWEKLSSKNRFHDWRGVGNNDANLSDFLSRLKPLTNEPSLVIMKDLTKMYGGLYDLLNRNFTKKQKKEKDLNNEERTVTQRTCYVYYAGTKQEVDVHENFKIIILTGRAFGKTEEEIQQNYPAPFLNRFEKFFITQAMLPNLIAADKYLEIQRLKSDPELVKLMKNNRFIGLSEDMVISGVDVDNSHEKVREVHDSRIVEALVEVKYGEENQSNPDYLFEMDKYLKNNFGMFQLCHMATFNILLDADEEKRNIFKAISKSKQFEFYLERVNTELSTGSALNIEKEVTSKAIVLTFSPITKDYELKSRTGGCHFKHKMGIEFITKSTEEIKKDLMSILEEKKGNSNLIIQFGSPTEFQKLQNIRVAIDEINAAAREMTRSSDFSKAGEASRSAIEEESNHSIAEKPAKYSFVNVLVIMHLSTHSIELRKLNNLPGLNFWFGWELRVIEKLDMNSVHVKIREILYKPRKFHDLFILSTEEVEKTDNTTLQCKQRLREFQMTILGRLLYHEYQLFARQLVRSNAYLNLSSLKLGEVKRNLLPEVSDSEMSKEGYFLKVFEEEMSYRILTDSDSKDWTKYLGEITETKNSRLGKGGESRPEDNDIVYVDIETAISTAFQIENGDKIRLYMKYLMLPKNLNNLSAYILGCSNKVEGLNGPHDEVIERFLTLDEYDFLDYIRDNQKDKYEGILGPDENEWYERISTEFNQTFKNPIFEFQMSMRTFLNKEENRFASFSPKASSKENSNSIATIYKLPIYKENYEQIQKIVQEFKVVKKYLFNYGFKDLKRIIKLYKKCKESKKAGAQTEDNYQVEMYNFKNNEKLVNLIFDPETTKEQLPSWMVKGVYTAQTKDFYFEMFLDLIKTLFPDSTRPYSDQEYYTVFELITLCLREPSKEEAESPLFFFKGVFFAFQFLNSIIKNIMINIHNNETELEYLKSNLKKLSEVQIQKTEAGKKGTKGKSELPKQNSEAEQKKKSEAFSFILLDEMSTKVELRNLISNGIDIQKPQEKVDPKKKNLLNKNKETKVVSLEDIITKNFKTLINAKRTQFNELSQYTGPFITILEMLLYFDTKTQISVFNEIKEEHQKELNSGDTTGGEVFTAALLKRGRELFQELISKIKAEPNEKLQMKNIYLIKSFIDVWGTYEHLDYFVKDKRFCYVFSKELYGGKGASILRIALTERFANELRDLECTIDGKKYSWVDLQHKNAEAEVREIEERREEMDDQEQQIAIEYAKIREEIQKLEAFKTYNSTVSFLMANFEENKSIIITLMDSIWKSALSTRRKGQGEGGRLQFDKDIYYSVVSELDPNKLCGIMKTNDFPNSQENEIPAEIPQKEQNGAKRELDSTLPLNTVLNITMMRVLFSKEKLAKLNTPEFEVIDTTFREKLTSLSNMSSTLINSSANYGLIYLMQCFVTHETSIAKLSKYCPTVKKLEDSLNVKAGESNIVFFDPKLIEYYKQLLNEVDVLVENCLNSEAEVPNFLLLINREYRGSRSMNMYVLGVICINKFIKKEGELNEYERAKRGNYQKVFSKCSQKAPQTPDLSSYLQIIDNILTGNVMRRYSDWIDGIGEDQKESMNLLLVKLFSQFSILVACFSEMNYKLDAWKEGQVTKKLSQKGMCCKIVNTNIFNQFVSCLETIIRERLNDPGYRDYGSSYVKNLGCYRCSCKYMYTVNNCGYTMVSFPCPWCKQPIGGANHVMVNRPGHLHVKTFPEINDLILEEYNANVANYVPHYPLNNQSEAYRSMRILEVGYNKLIEFKDKFSENPLLFVNFENDLYLRHLMDHIFIVSSRNFVRSQEFQLYDSVLQEALNLKDIDFYKDFSPERYFMRHINNDLEKLNGLLKFSTPMEKFDWLKATFSTMAENMFQKVPADTDSKLFIQRTMFSEAKEFITKQDAIDSEMSKENLFTDESIVQILINRKQLFERKDAMAVLESRPEVLKSLYILNTLCRHEVLPNDVFAYLKDILDQIEPSRVELLRSVLRYEQILKDYPKFMEVHLSLTIYMRNKYSRSLSYESTMEATFEPELKKDENLKSLYANFVAIWNKMESYKESLPELFAFSDMCTANINVPEFIDRVTKQDKAMLKDFLIFSRSGLTQDESLLYFRSIIGSFVKNFHNMVSAQVSRILSEAGEDSEGEKGEKISLEEATYSDFVYLDTSRIPVMGKGLQNKAIEELVLENCMFDITRANEIVFDTHKIQLILAKALYKPPILAEEDNFIPFEFEFSGSNQKSRIDAEKILQSLKTESRSEVALLQTYLKGRFPDKSSKDKEVIETVDKLFLFIVDMVEFLKVRLDLEDLNQTIESKMKGQQKETYFRYENLQKEFKDLELEEQDWRVGDLPQLYEEVLEKAVDSLVKDRLRAKKIGEVEARKISSLFADHGIKKNSNMVKHLEAAIKEKAKESYPDMRFTEQKISYAESEFLSIEEECMKENHPDCKPNNQECRSNNAVCFNEIKDYRIDQFGCLLDILK